jgi:serine/threonine protein kinase
LYVLFEHPHKTLNDEIAERQERNSRFQEKELWSILASCILGLCHLQNADIKHQALRSDTILLAAEGSILVADPYCTSEQTNYETLLNKRNTQHIYLSPELCQALHD